MMIAAVALTFAGCKKDDVAEKIDIPPYAASTKTWTFGSSTLTWSDAIHCHECDRESFTESYTDPQCRSYTSGTTTWYYYNWPYVDVNKEKLCPSPWRVPSWEDFLELMGNTSASRLIAEWGYGGYADGSSMSNVSTVAYYWSSTEDRTDHAYYLYYYSSLIPTESYYNEHFGYQIRCVK